MKVLLVEDDAGLARDLSHCLEESRLVAETVDSAEDALIWPEPDDLSCILLDLSLPGMDGQEFIYHWRAAGRHTPIVVLSARSRWEQKVNCLNAGADDYLVKPVHPDELVARIRAVVRRAADRPLSSWMEHGGIRLHVEHRLVEVDGTEVKLTSSEFRLLHLLMRHIGTPLSKERIFSHLYSLEKDFTLNTVDVNLFRLRRKIGKNKILNLRGIGYKIAC